jgi:dethiobiotin synthetase
MAVLDRIIQRKFTTARFGRSSILIASGAVRWFDRRSMGAKTLFITGTDTGVGKTILTSLLAGHLRGAGLRVAALKPLCSGGRADARALREATGRELALDTINPWHFRAALTPLLAARREGRRVLLADVLAWLRKVRRAYEVTLVEGAGGLLSPLGEDFNGRDLITALRTTPIVVCPNRLGAVSQALLVLAALPRRAAAHAPVVLVEQAQADPASRSNPALLAECIGAKRIHRLPWLAGTSARPSLPRVLQGLCRAVGIALPG